MPNVYTRVVLIDNFDSFTYNLVDFLRRLGCSVEVYRNTVDPEALAALDFDLLVLSPGPKLPADAGNLLPIIARFHRTKPLLGICLGHQAIGQFFGGALYNSGPRHGKAERIVHDGKTLYRDLPKAIEVARYHSWAVQDLPGELEITARAPDGTVMGLRHRYLPIEGVQFHPESVLSMRGEVGYRLLENLVRSGLGTGFPTYRTLMHRLQHAPTLAATDLETYLEALSAGQLADDHQLALLVALVFRLHDAPTLAQFCERILSRATLGHTPQVAALAATAVDLCGTGGSHLPRLNTSTLAALLLSGLGLPVLKHGNRAASGRYGSADLVADWGLPLEVPESALLEAFAQHRLAFVYARQAHPVVARLAGARTRVGIPTLFNVLGPLLNPYRPHRQLIGTAYPEYAELLLRTAHALGRREVLVVHGGEGLDEVSVSAPTTLWRLVDGEVVTETLTPEDFGLAPIPFEQVAVPRPTDNRALAQAIAESHLTTEHYRLVAANAALAYHHFVAPVPLPQAYAKMVAALKAGVIGQQLEALRRTLTPATAAA
ncbi:MAG: anthranilate phosphoribosyltransferase [Bacteroidia bacterium]|nr:anthranilate phosphoribosyltransferase [Bacteroidia bacterium]